MRVLVTGGSGYVGSVVCERLTRAHEVVSFDSRLPEHGHGRFIRGDILNSAHLLEAMNGIDAVVHLAAIPHPAYDPSDAVMMINVMGTQRVVESAALGSPKRLVFASSDSAYGFVFGRGEILPSYLPVDEDHPAEPLDCYGLSKLLGEEICRRYTRSHALETVCLRYCWVWNEALYQNLAGLSRDPGQFVGQLWGYVDARDVAQAVEKSLTTPGITHATLNISALRTFQTLPTLDLVDRYLPDVAQLDDSVWDDPHCALISIDRARDLIGFEPEYDCREQAGLTA